jgi:Mg2+ and Co2+ transporter CorA
MDESTLWKVLEALVGLVVAGGAWVMKGMHSDIRESQRHIAELRTEVSTNRAVMDGAIKSVEEMREDIREMAGDIKQLLQRVK